MLERHTSTLPRLHRPAIFAALAVLLLTLSLSPAWAEEVGHLAPENLRCPGFMNPESTRPGPEYVLTGWEFRWEVLSADADLTAPMGVALDRDCNTYVANYDPLGGKILKLSPSGEVVARWGSGGKGLGQFERLEGIAVDGAGRIFAADSGNNRIQRFTRDGVVDAVWANVFACRSIAGVPCHVVPQAEEFHGSLTVGVDGAGILYVVDGAHGVKKFAPMGGFLGRFGVPLSDAPGGFRAGDGVAIDTAGNVYVTDSLQDRIQKFGPDGALRAQFSIGDSALILLDTPRGAAVDRGGNVYVADTDNHRLVIFSTDGEPVAWAGRCVDEEVSPCARMGIGDAPGEFTFPHHVTVTGRSELVVADRYNARVQVLKAHPVWELPPSIEGEGGA